MLNPNLSNLDRSATSSTNSFSPKQHKGDVLTNANSFEKHLKNQIEQLQNSRKKQPINVDQNSAELGKLEVAAEYRKTELDFQEVQLTQFTDASLKEDPVVETSTEDIIVEPAPTFSPSQIERNEEKNSAMNTDPNTLLLSDMDRNFEGGGKLPNSPIEFALTITEGEEFDNKLTAPERVDVNKTELTSVAKSNSLTQANTQDPAISLGEKTTPETGQAVKHNSDVSRTIATRIVETLTNEAPTAESPGSKKITLTLNPAELGKLTLQVGWENETLKAVIIATDLNTTDLLNRDKNLLLDTLNENGLSFSEFDIGHSAADPDASESNGQQTIFDTATNSPEPASTAASPARYGVSERGSVVNIVT